MESLGKCQSIIINTNTHIYIVISQGTFTPSHKLFHKALSLPNTIGDAKANAQDGVVLIQPIPRVKSTHKCIV